MSELHDGGHHSSLHKPFGESLIYTTLTMLSLSFHTRTELLSNCWTLILALHWIDFQLQVGCGGAYHSWTPLFPDPCTTSEDPIGLIVNTTALVLEGTCCTCSSWFGCSCRRIKVEKGTCICTCQQTHFKIIFKMKALFLYQYLSFIPISSTNAFMKQTVKGRWQRSPLLLGWHVES